MSQEGITDNIVSNVIERLGDGKQTVRDEAQRVLQTLVTSGANSGEDNNTISIVFTSLGGSGLSHKNWRVREQTLLCFAACIGMLGSQASSLQEYLSTSISLLEDPNANVRKSCFSFLEQIYSRMGQRLIAKLEKSNIRPSLLSTLSDQLRNVPIASEDDMFPSPINQQQQSQQSQQTKSTRTKQQQQQSKKPSSRENSNLPRSTSFQSQRQTNAPSNTGERGDTPPPVVRITSEKQMEKEVEDISNALSSLENDWEKRVAALRRLQGIIRGGVAEIPGFMPLLVSKLKEPVGNQCLDLRSLVAKEAGKSIESLSSTLGDSLEPLCDYFVEVLFKLAATANKVMAECGNQAMKCMLQHSRAGKGVNRIIETLATSKSAILRQRAAEYLCIVLQQGNRYSQTGTLEKLADHLEIVIRTSVSDGSPGVRAAARLAYWKFSALWKERGSRLFDMFEPNIKRLVMDDERKANSMLFDVGNNNLNSTTSSCSSTGSQHSTSSSPAILNANKIQLPSKPKSLTSSTTATSKPPPQKTQQQKPITSKPNQNTNEFTGLTAMKRVESKQEIVETPSTSPFTSIADMHKMFGKKPTSQTTTNNSSTNGRQQQQQQQQQQQAEEPTETFPLVSTNSSQSTQSVPVLSASVMQKQLHSNLSSFRHISKQASTSTSSSTSPTTTMEQIVTSNSVSGSISVSPVLSTSTSTTTTPRSPLSDIRSILEAGVSIEWNTRLFALTELKNMLGGPNARLMIPHMDQIVGLLERHLDDQHSRVTREALELLSCFLHGEMFGLIAPSLNRLLPPVLRKASASTNQQELRMLAERTQNEFLSRVDAAMLVPVVIRLLEQRVSNNKILMSCLDLIRGSMQKNPEYFANSFHLKQLIPPLVVLLSERSPDIRELAQVLLHQLFGNHKEEFVSAFIGLSASDFQECKKTLCPLMPDFETELISRSGGETYSTNKRITQPPPRQHQNSSPPITTTTTTSSSLLLVSTPPSNIGLARLADSLHGETNKTKCLSILTTITDKLTNETNTAEYSAVEHAVFAISGFTTSGNEDAIRTQALMALQKATLFDLQHTAAKKAFISGANVLIETIDRPTEPVLQSATALLVLLESNTDRPTYVKILMELCLEDTNVKMTEIVMKELSKAIVKLDKEQFLKAAKNLIESLVPLLESTLLAQRRDATHCLAYCCNTFGETVVEPFLAPLSQTQRALINKTIVTMKSRMPTSR